MSAIQASFTDGVLTATDGGGNSATLALSQGDLSIDGILPDGRELVKGETRGALTGVRKGARAYPTMKVTGKLAAPNDTFQALARGTTAGYVSVLADIGDYKGCDFVFSFNYGAELRSYYGDDIVCTGMATAEGSPSTISYTFEILGPLYSKDSTGIHTIIASR